MGMEITLDHVVIAVSDWARSNAFNGAVLGADVVELAPGLFASRLGGQQLNVHGPDSEPFPVARERVRPAAAHPQRHGVEIEVGPVERGGARGPGRSV